MPAALTVDGLSVDFDGFKAVNTVSMIVDEGELRVLLGANGAGKTTTLKAISGLLRTERGRVTKGSIDLDGRRLDPLAAHEVVQQGVVQVFEGRRVFASLTVEENLVAGAHTRHDAKAMRENIERVYDSFPRLKERRHLQSGYLSGGEQQMLVIGRALMSEPKAILLDEPSLGLAPLIMEEIFSIIRRLKEERNLIVLIVEQNAALVLDIADHGYVMENGRIVLEGPAKDLRNNSDIKEFYLGLNEIGARKSYRDVKHYKRRKRWLS
jgi:branched-chain amino acid transport system ATP-binding protein